jgi:DNA-binding transcriptional MerR regulator
MSGNNNGNGLLYSVGKIAAETGVTPDMLRVWERRYGVPTPVRLPSGHRRYTHEQLVWLRQIAEALALGHKPQSILRLSASDLRCLVREKSGRELRTDETSAWLGSIREMRVDCLASELRRAAADSDPLDFLHGRLSPLLSAMGTAWSRGELDIRQEHAAAEVIEDHLRAMRSRRATLRRTPCRARIVLATLPGEPHRLGIQMAGVVCETRDVCALILGSETPVEEISRTAFAEETFAVGIGISLYAAGVESDRALSLLRGQLPSRVHLVAGGEGARKPRNGPRSVHRFRDLPGFAAWLDRSLPSA